MEDNSTFDSGHTSSSPRINESQVVEQVIQGSDFLPSSSFTGSPARHSPMAPQPNDPISTNLSLPASHLPISGSMSTTEVIACLKDHGCQDITNRLDLDACDKFPMSNGGFGDVYIGKLIDGPQVAIKTMRILIGTDKTQKPFKNAARELHIWSKCQHPNVIQLLGLVEFHNQIGMVSDWMENGILPAYLRKHPEVDRCQMSTDICKGLAYLHAANIVHGDLKGPNVLVSNEGTPMLTDFGNAILQESTLRFTATSTNYALSARWAAPELTNGPGKHSLAADVYALGMTILETITGKVPYSEKSELGVYMALARGELPPQPEDSIPPNSKDGNRVWELLTACWAQDPEVRPSASQVQDTMYTIKQEGLRVFQVGVPEEGGSEEEDRGSQKSASSTGVDLVTKAIVEYLRKAIRMGDRLPNMAHVGAAKRRALIVTPQYWENYPGARYPELPLAIKDAFRIHKMLVKHGYDPKNIRILADRIEPDGFSDPSGDHVNKSLDWLVQGSRPGDYRFFHFTGHGIRLHSKVGEGQPARVVSVEPSNDGELTMTHGRIKKQTNQIVYYSEALLTSYRPPPLFSDTSDEEYSLIRDQRLNKVFASLPEGCVLTYVFDCSTSGRLIGNSTKLAGGGFRGKRERPIPSRTDTQTLQDPPRPDDFLIPGGHNVAMHEGLPEDRYKIKAKLTTWAASHQRSEVGGGLYSNSGRFIRAFTKTVAAMIPLPGYAPPTIGEVFEQVEKLIKRDAIDSEDARDGKSRQQHPQVWTSIRGDDGVEAFERLKHPFVI